ncbi:MAG: glycosyltransferase family A protein [Leptolyngbyaceae cyanobacterium bins.349]|nr:glycosyltransferase family A protein [Leptolyngbyaceae cyanobacterium bins.349]
MSKPRFTFCIPNLNKIKYLPACIESVLAQDCDDWCCVFVDGYSADGSWEYIQQFASDPRFKLLRGLKQGMYADWNECLRHVNTEYFYFLTSDDTCDPTLVSTTMATLDHHPTIHACHFQFSWIDEKGKTIKTYDEILSEIFPLYQEVANYSHIRNRICEFILHFAYQAIYMTITSLVFRSLLIEKLQGFSTQYGSVSDYDWTMRLCFHTDVIYIPKLLATWRIYPDQATGKQQAEIATSNLIKIAENNGFIFCEKRFDLALSQQLNIKLLLSHLNYEHKLNLFREIRKSKSLIQNIQYFSSILSQHTGRFIMNSLRRFHSKQCYLPASRTDFAHELIRKYNLVWPPQRIDQLLIRN